MVAVICLSVTTAIFAALWVVTRGELVEARSIALVVAKRGILYLHKRGVPRRKAVRMIAPELVEVLEGKKDGR